MILHLLHSSTPKISSCWLKTLSVDAFPLINMNELISTSVNLVVLLLIGSRRPDCPSLLCCHSVSDSFVFFLFCCTTGVFPFIFKVTTTCFPHLTSRCFLLCFDSSVAILTPPPSQPFFYYQISFFFSPWSLSCLSSSPSSDVALSFHFLPFTVNCILSIRCLLLISLSLFLPVLPLFLPPVCGWTTPPEGLFMPECQVLKALYCLQGQADTKCT